MKVGLIDVDSKIPNLALMKISAYHKSLGDSVKIYEPLFDSKTLDLVYASKVFKFSSTYQYNPECKVIRGGSGYDLETKLPNQIETCCPDYSLYNMDYAMGFTSRGCIRNCGFCIVPQKEGRWHPVADIDQFWQGQKNLTLLDNNLTSDAVHFERIAKQLIKHKIKTDITQGLDIRLIDDDKAKLLSMIRREKDGQIPFAWDSMDIEQDVLRGIELLTKYIKPRYLKFYVLIGWDTDPDEDLYRVEMLRSLKVDPFAMAYNKEDPYQADFARWTIHKATFKTKSWHEYKGRMQPPCRTPQN